MRAIRPTCERTSRLVSLRLDGELSEHEERLLERHLTLCSECRAFAATSAALTDELRAAPLLELSTPVSLPHRRGLSERGLRVAAAAASMAAVGLATVFALASSTQPARSPALRPLVREPAAPVVVDTTLGLLSPPQVTLGGTRRVGTRPGPQLR